MLYRKSAASGFESADTNKRLRSDRTHVVLNNDGQCEQQGGPVGGRSGRAGRQHGPDERRDRRLVPPVQTRVPARTHRPPRVPGTAVNLCENLYIG